MYLMQLIADPVVRTDDMVDLDLHAHHTKRNPMQMACVVSFNTTIPPVLEGPKEGSVKEGRYEFNAMQTYAMWNPTGSKGTWANINCGMNKQMDRVKAAIDMKLARHSTAKTICYAMLAEVKTFWVSLFKTELTNLYHELLGKAYGKPPYPKDAMATCWSLTMELLKVLFEELIKVRVMACAAHLHEDKLQRNGLFFFAALQEIKVMQEVQEHDFSRHSKVLMHVFNTYVPKSLIVKKSDKTASLQTSLEDLRGKFDTLKRAHDSP